VSVFGVGDIIYKTVLDNLRKSYAALPGLVAKFIADRGGHLEGIAPPQPDPAAAAEPDAEQASTVDDDDSSARDAAGALRAPSAGVSQGSPFLSQPASRDDSASVGGGGGGGGGGADAVSPVAMTARSGTRSRRSSRSRRSVRGHRRHPSGTSLAHGDEALTDVSEFHDAMSGDDEMLMSDPEGEDMEKLYPSGEFEIARPPTGHSRNPSVDRDRGSVGGLRMPSFTLRNRERGTEPDVYQRLADELPEERAVARPKPAPAPRIRTYGTAASSPAPGSRYDTFEGSNYALFEEGGERKPSVMQRLLRCCMPPKRVSTIQHTGSFS
jgi:hypothetical protein